MTVVLEVAGTEKQIRGPGRNELAAAERDLDAVREFLGSGDWINLNWLSANPKNVVAAFIASNSISIA